MCEHVDIEPFRGRGWEFPVLSLEDERDDVLYHKFTFWFVSADGTTFWACVSVAVEVCHETWPTENMPTVET